MDIDINKENSQFSLGLHRNKLPVKTLGAYPKFSQKGHTPKLNYKGQGTSSTNRKALGNVSNVPVFTKTAEPKSKDSEYKKAEPIPAHKAAETLESTKEPILEEEETWPDIEYQPENEPDTDDEEIWANLSLEHITPDDVSRFHKWQPEREIFMKPESPSPPAKMETFHFPFISEALDMFNNMDNQLEFSFDDGQMMFVPLD